MEEAMIALAFKDQIRQGIGEDIPNMPAEELDINHAPARKLTLTDEEQILAVKNALRYFPAQMQAKLAPEFANELLTLGRIYMHRFRPIYKMHARRISEYPANCQQAAAMMLMIQNNLDPRVAQHPYELITYGGNGTVFQNWAQYLLTMQYLSKMTENQTLIMNSGHPLGLFPSSPEMPRAVISNGMVIPNFSQPEDYNRLAALGVTSYGQMTAGSWMYIGSQGILHGTTITLLNAGRLYLGLEPGENLKGKLFVSSGLGGMSGAQAKAAVIAGAVGVIAEINPKMLKMRLENGWLDEYFENLDDLIPRIRQAVKDAKPLSIGYLGNIVDLWERLVKENIQVDLGSDQTSLHIPYTGGYYPVGMTLEEAQKMMVNDSEQFKIMVSESLHRQVNAINILCQRGMHFWDYGNAFLLEASKAGADVLSAEGKFIYPSYVEDIMGPLYFDYGFGPFRWVCTSGDPRDLQKTDQIAIQILEKFAENAEPQIKQQILDNLHWIREAEKNDLVVGSQARILYANWQGRIAIGQAFNKAIASGEITAPVVIGRDHHDTGGTDSPYRETANVYDSSNLTADMAIQNFAGDAMRGATWVSMHNGGGVGWGNVINGGFGFVLDGNPETAKRFSSMQIWDVINGLARRQWAGNEGAKFAINQSENLLPGLQTTFSHSANDELIASALEAAKK